jgi:hypothetical protein
MMENSVSLLVSYGKHACNIVNISREGRLNVLTETGETG